MLQRVQGLVLCAYLLGHIKQDGAVPLHVASFLVPGPGTPHPARMREAGGICWSGSVHGSHSEWRKHELEPELSPALADRASDGSRDALPFPHALRAHALSFETDGRTSETGRRRPRSRRRPRARLELCGFEIRPHVDARRCTAARRAVARWPWPHGTRPSLRSQRVRGTIGGMREGRGTNSAIIPAVSEPSRTFQVRNAAFSPIVIFFRFLVSLLPFDVSE